MREEYFVQGNTVRKMNTAPKRIPDRMPEKKVVKKTSTQVKRNQKRALAIGKSSAAFFVIAMVMILSACIYMLKLQAEIAAQNKNIATLEMELNNLVDNNDAVSSRLDGETNISEIFRIATEELGMVYATSGQVLLYEQTNPDYVRQYEDIPEVR